MTNFPISQDDDISLPPVYDNINEVGGDAINALRSAMFAVEEEMGLGGSGTMGSLAARLNVSINSDGTIAPEALEGIGLAVLPITNTQISSTAAIQESKLNLTYATQTLHDLINIEQDAIDVLNNFVAITGIKIQPHIDGSAYRHKLSHIDVDTGVLTRVNIGDGSTSPRNLTNSYTLASQLSGDLLTHTRADGINNNLTPPAGQAHNASGIYINPFYFSSVPQTANDLQKFAEYVDSSSLALLGSRTQNLYEGGVPRASRAASMVNSKAGEAIVDTTNAITYLLYGSATSPIDHIDHGDDIIYLQPSSASLANNTFDAQFSQVKSGDYITVVYDSSTPTVTFAIDSVKKFLNGTTRVYSVRINGKNLKSSTSAIVRIDRPFYHDNKFSSLSVASANNLFGETPSLIINSAKGASSLGVGFYSDQLNSSHYNLYLALYPTGNPLDKTLFLPPIDVTGNQGKTPGAYTLEHIVFNFNQVVRQPGFNYRFNAFSYRGQLGISLSDHYSDASFSIISGIVDNNGLYTDTSLDGYQFNVVDNFNGLDPLGFGLVGAGSATPPFGAGWGSPIAGLNSPTIIFAPLRKDFFYVDGVERDSFALQPLINRDGYGDGYWNAILTTRTSLSGRVEVAYEIDLDLSTSGLKNGKTLVVEPSVAVTSGTYNSIDYGRFIISNVLFNNCPGPDPITIITVYDGIHGTGISPRPSSVNIPVRIYFNDDSVSFNSEAVSDSNIHHSFKRFFEVYMDSTGNSHTHERARFNMLGTDLTIDSANGFILYSSAEFSVMNIVNVSPKLKGYSFGQYKKITLVIDSYNVATGIFVGRLAKYEYPSTFTNFGPDFTGKKGEVIRCYDETEVDYIDIKFDINTNINTFSNKQIDIQIYPSLELNQEQILIGKAQVDDTANTVNTINDVRQFGNVSEKQLSTSALNYIAAPQRLLSENGIIRGLDLIGYNSNSLNLKGGAVLVNGKIIEINDKTFYIPNIIETIPPAFTLKVSNVKWYLCANELGNLEFIASTDFDPANTATYGSLDHDRIFYAFNTLDTIAPYAIRSGYLQNIISSRKDLVPLFIVNTFATESHTTNILNVNDIRRFVAGGYSGLSQPIVLSNAGSYRTIDSINNTLADILNNISFSKLKYNSFGQQVIVRNIFDLSNIALDFASQVKFVGEGGGFATSSSSVSIGNNITFENLSISVPSQIGLNIVGDNVKINNCTIDYGYDATSDGTFTIGNLCNFSAGCLFIHTASGSGTNVGHRTNVSVNDCTFTSSVVNRFPFVNFVMFSSGDYFENINITNNTIKTLTNSSVDDKLAAIVLTSVASTPTNANTTLSGRIVNSKISNNICNKNQLILMSGQTASSKIINMLSPVKVIIEKNICGAICYLVRQDRSLNTVNTTRVNDKNNALIISENTCRYIYCGANNGFINIIGSTNRLTYDFIAVYNLYSSSTIIKNNSCSWIHVGMRNPDTTASPTFTKSTLELDGNTLTAYNPAFLTDYHSVITPLNIGLIVDSVQGS